MARAGSYSGTSARTRSIAFCGLSVAVMAVSAWISVPLGPVPFTLQTFALVFVLLALTPAQATASTVAYVGMGAIGLPVFSGMRGGLGVLMGPTGGFLLGYVVGIAVAAYARKAMIRWFAEGGACAPPHRTAELAADVAAAALFMVICYACGWLQLVVVSGMAPGAAFAVGVAPFLIVDCIKAAVAIVVARAVRKAVGSANR